MTAPLATAVVPTRNRRLRLTSILAALGAQTVPASKLEIVVVDDGSTDGTADALESLEHVDVIRQDHQGPAAARNAGARRARGTWLVFVDDDVELAPGAVGSLLDAHARHPGAVCVGRLAHPAPVTPFERLGLLREPSGGHGEIEISFTKCFAGLLSVARDDFLALGGFQDPTGSWPSWDDVDFGYRATAAGLRIVRVDGARAVHHSDWAVSLDAVAERELDAARAAVGLFRRYPGIEAAFPIYRDKLPIDVGRDGVLLAGRKLLRTTASSRPVRACLRQLARALIAGGAGRAARPVAGCFVSGHQWLGIRSGLEAFGPLETPSR